MALSPLGITLSMQQPMVPAREGSIAPTDVLGAYNLATNAANTQYLAKLQQQNAMWGGLAGLGSAGMMAAPWMYKSGMLNGLFGPSTAATTGSAGAASGVPLSILPDAVSSAAPVSDALDTTMLGYAAPAGGDALASLGGTAAADTAGTVGADLAAAAAPAAADAAGSFSLADILPFLFAA